MKAIKHPKILAKVKCNKLNQRMQSFKLDSNPLTQQSNRLKLNNRTSIGSQHAMSIKEMILNQFVILYKVNRVKINFIISNYKQAKKCSR